MLVDALVTRSIVAVAIFVTCDTLEIVDAPGDKIVGKLEVAQLAFNWLCNAIGTLAWLNNHNLLVPLIRARSDSPGPALHPASPCWLAASTRETNPDTAAQ